MVRKKNKMFVDSADRTPHYSLRKLSVGVASVLLSTTLWMGANGSVAHADTINDATVAGKVENDPSETQTVSNGQTQSQNGQGQDAASVVTGANQTKNKEGSSDNAEAQTATANDAQADVAKQEPAAQSQQTAPQAQVSAPASVKEQASTAEGQTNGSANADAANNATKKDSAHPEANSSAAATEDAKNESTTLDVNQAFKMPINKKMVMASLASADKPTNMADSISENKPTATTAVPGFSVTDPEYPSEMYRDPDPEHYSFFWVGQKDNDYQTVISTNRNGDGQIHVFELDQSNKVRNSFDLDKNQSGTSRWTGLTYYNDEYAGLVSTDSRELTLKYEVSGGKSDQLYDSISFIVPRLNTQVTSYVTSYKDKDGKDIITDIVDKNGNKIEPVVQQGLDGQKYTTTDTKVIDGYYAIAPSNAQGTMSPYGKIGSKYEKNYHDGYISEYTQINNDGDMYVQMYREDELGNRIAVTRAVIIKPGDIYTYSRVGKTYYLRSIYIPQTIDIKYVYKKLGNTVLVDKDNNPFMGNTPTQYPNDPNDPTKAGKVVIPQYEGYTPTINGVPVGPDGFIPTDPGKDTYVVYKADTQKATVTYIDDTDNKTLHSDILEGDSNSVASFKDGTPYTTKSSIEDYENKGYEFVSDNTKGQNVVFDTDSSVDQNYEVHLKHGTVIVTPDDKNPVKPGDKINPNDPNSPKYQDDVKHDNLAKDAKQTVHYEGAGTDTPADSVTTQKDAFTRTVTYDKVTGKSTTSGWSKPKTTFDKVDTPVVKGYTADKKQAGGLTATPDKPEVKDTVVYTPNGSIVPVDPNGNPIPGTNPVPYETDPTDPTKVVDGKVPEVPSWTPKNGKPGDPVKPSDPTKDTEVPYDHTMTPGETTVPGKVEGLPEKPAKAPAEKLVKTPVKASKAVKTAEPAKTISIKESAQAQDQLPQTGEDNSKAAFGLGLASILGGIGILGAFKRKKKEN